MELMAIAQLEKDPNQSTQSRIRAADLHNPIQKSRDIMIAHFLLDFQGVCRHEEGDQAMLQRADHPEASCRSIPGRWECEILAIVKDFEDRVKTPLCSFRTSQARLQARSTQ